MQNGSVAKFSFWGEMEILSYIKSMTYRHQSSSKTNFATEPARVAFKAPIQAKFSIKNILDAEIECLSYIKYDSIDSLFGHLLIYQ